MKDLQVLNNTMIAQFQNIGDINALKTKINQQFAKKDQFYFIEDLINKVDVIREKVSIKAIQQINTELEKLQSDIEKWEEEVNQIPEEELVQRQQIHNSIKQATAKIDTLRDYNKKIRDITLCFNEVFIKDMFEGIDILDISGIKDNQQQIEVLSQALLPVAFIEGASHSIVSQVVERLFSATKVYGKTDGQAIENKAKELIDDLREFSAYAIQKGVRKYYKNNREYPTLKELIDIIKPINDKGLLLYANIQFLLSL